MKGSQELIAHFDMREEALGEKATKFNMFLEGYAVGYNDTKEYLIDKACKYLSSLLFDGYDYEKYFCSYDGVNDFIKDFQKVMKK